MKEQREGKYRHQGPIKMNLKGEYKNQIRVMVQNLIKKRQQHQARIDKLLGPNFLSQDVTQETIKHNQREFSHLLKQLEQSEKIECQEIQISMGALTNHVNLLATVSLKTEYYLAESDPISSKQNGNLYKDLRKQIGEGKISFRFDQNSYPQNFPHQLLSAIEYVKSEELGQGLFVQTILKQRDISEQFFGTRFYLGKYEEIQLSKEGLQQQEKLYILKNKTSVNISLLLLQRLTKQKKRKSFPQVLNCLFSYPIKSFLIHQSSQLISFNDFIDEFSKVEEEKSENRVQRQRIKVIGIQQKTNRSYQIENIPKTKKLKNYRQILDQYSRLMIVIQEELPVKHIPLSCLQNHFVVVTMNIKSSGRYYISMGSSGETQKFQVYIIDMEGEVIYGEKVLKNQFLFCNLKEDTYQIYVRPIPLIQTQNKSEQSFQLVNDHQYHFTLWIQGRLVYQKNQQVNLEIRLKEEYNNLTMKIAHSYLKKNVPNYTSLQLKQYNSDIVLIKRLCISRLGLYLDTFFYHQNQPFIVTYKGNFNISDVHFQESQVELTHEKSLCLYNNCQIQSIRSSKNSMQSFTKFEIMFFYV